MTELWRSFAEGELFPNIVTAVLILVIGILATRVLLSLLKKTLEKSNLEKAAFSLITSLTRW